MVNVGYAPVILTRCEDVVQHTTDTGQLVFDAYYYPLLYLYNEPEGLGIESLTATFTWPAEWGFVQAYEPIDDGYGSLQPWGDGYRLVWSFYGCPVITLDDPLLFIGRFVLNVTGPGRFECEIGGDVDTCPDGGTIPESGYGSAQAGVGCSFCDESCELTMPSWADLTPEELPIEAQQGNDASGSFSVMVNDMAPPQTISFETDVDWLDFEWSWVDHYLIELEVTAHTSGLEPGLHSARVRSVTEDCTGCAWVRLTVLPSAQGVEEEPGDQPPKPIDEGNTWGLIKALYR